MTRKRIFYHVCLPNGEVEYAGRSERIALAKGREMGLRVFRLTNGGNAGSKTKEEIFTPPAPPSPRP